jgi:hypothetical protein
MDCEDGLPQKVFNRVFELPCPCHAHG